jgi:hypothetical protein
MCSELYKVEALHATPLLFYETEYSAYKKELSLRKSGGAQRTTELIPSVELCESSVASV